MREVVSGEGSSLKNKVSSKVVLNLVSRGGGFPSGIPLC